MNDDVIRIENFGNRTLKVTRVDSGMGTFEEVATLREEGTIVWFCTIPKDKHLEGSAAIIEWVEKERPVLLEKWSHELDLIREIVGVDPATKVPSR
jgi:hypothetical protein